MTAEKFIKFLKDNDAYEKYMVNFKKHWPTITLEVFPEDDPEDYLDTAFVWEGSPEGATYWCDIDDKYLELLGAEQ